MTKRNLLLLSLILLFGLATAPGLFAQQGSTWGASANVNTVRSEGDAEGVGTITLSNDTIVTPQTISASSGFTITYSEPLAVIGGVYAVGVTCAGPDAPGLCSHANLNILPGIAQNGTANPNALTLVWPAGLLETQTGDSINVAARLKVQGVAYGTLVTANIVAFYKLGAPLTLIGTVPSITVGLGAVGPKQALTITERSAHQAGPEYVLTCIGVKDVAGSVLDNDFSFTMLENWNDALTSLSDEYTLENNDANYVGGSGSYVYPTNGSDILVTLTGIPPNVGVVGLSPIPCDGVDSSDPNYCAGGYLVIDSPIDVTKGAPYGGTQQFWYQVESTNISAIEWAKFPFKLWSKGPLPPNQNYQIVASITLTDLYPEDGSTDQIASKGMPWFSLPEFTGSVVEFKDCVTKLLFPYINTYNSSGSAFSHFGTGINFANTTWDPFALTDGSGNFLYPDEAAGSAVPQSGNCLLYLYPADESATQLITTPVISAGGSWAFDVASNAKGFAGKTGYGIAICNFQNGYGFAEIYDNYGVGDPTATLGYMAFVLPEPAFYHRSPAGDGLGESAIAPVNINRLIEKILLTGGFFGGGI